MNSSVACRYSWEGSRGNTNVKWKLVWCNRLKILAKKEKMKAPIYSSLCLESHQVQATKVVHLRWKWVGTFDHRGDHLFKKFDLVELGTVPQIQRKSDLCQRRFGCHSSLRKHIRIHAEGKTFHWWRHHLSSTLGSASLLRKLTPEPLNLERFGMRFASLRPRCGEGGKTCHRRSREVIMITSGGTCTTLDRRPIHSRSQPKDIVC